MTDYKTMRVPEDAWQDAKGAKGENETWGEYLRRCADVDTGSTDAPSVDEREIANAVTSDLLASLPSKVADELRR
jgi:hypothetical protein